jgi:hypothetical protein
MVSPFEVVSLDLAASYAGENQFGAKSGDLYIAYGNVITPLIKSDDRWIVSVNGGDPEIWFVD